MACGNMATLFARKYVVWEPQMPAGMTAKRRKKPAKSLQKTVTQPLTAA